MRYDYMVVTSVDVRGLIARVNELVQSGWAPHGGVSIAKLDGAMASACSGATTASFLNRGASVVYAQAMILLAHTAE